MNEPFLFFFSEGNLTMGSLTVIKGNLFETDRQIIAHGVNCRGKFGAGVASQIAKRFPEVKRAYMRKFEKKEWKPGNIQIVQTSKNTCQSLIANCATQDEFGTNGVYVDYVDYNAVRQCMDSLLKFAEGEKLGVAMPMIGCGLAGGEWSKVEAILRDCLIKYNVEVDVYQL